MLLSAVRASLTDIANAIMKQKSSVLWRQETRSESENSTKSFPDISDTGIVVRYL